MFDVDVVAGKAAQSVHHVCVEILCTSHQMLSVSASHVIRGNYRVFQKKSFTHDKLGTVCRKMKIFALKCSAETTVYQSMPNLCERVKYSLLNSRKWLHVSKTVHRHTDRYTR